MQGRGRSLCSPDDPNGPLSGEEMAISRALRALSDRLREMALASEAHGEVPTAHLLE